MRKTRPVLIGLSVVALSWPAHAGTGGTGQESAAELFADHCARCHGPDGRGLAGVPDLTDDVWQFGGSYEAVERSITNGRSTVMPALGMALGEQGLDEVVAYVLSFSGSTGMSQDRLERGKVLFSIFCASCHGAEGTGTTELGARDLTDGIWIYGASVAEIRNVVANGRASDMPAQRDRLAAEELELLTHYVRNLGDAQSDE